MFKDKLLRKLFFTYLILIILSLAILSIITLSLFNQTYVHEISQRLNNNARLVRLIVKTVPENRLLLENKIKELGKDIQTRITIISSDGTILADSESDPETMVNHNNQPEVIQARTKSIGQDIRFSQTLSLDMLYLAIPFAEGNLSGKIVRVAIPLSQINYITRHVYHTVGITFLILMVVTVLMGFWLVRRIIQPLNNMVTVADAISHGDFSRELPITSTDEIGTLAKTINLMSDELQQRFTEIREKSTILDTTLSNITDGIIMINNESKIVFANIAASKLMDFDINKSIGRYIWEMVRQDKFIQFIKQSIGNSLPDHGYADITSFNSRQLRVYCTPIAGLPDNFVIVIYDITEQTRYEQLRKDFVANVSHELRTPLTFIKGYTETLREIPLEDKAKAKEFLDIIDKNVHQLTNLVEDLLELSKLESREGIARIKPTNLNQLIHRVIDNFQPAIVDKKHTLAKEISSGIPEINVDPNLLERAISNLLDNAIKYTPEGGKIEIITKTQENNLFVTIKDNGIGIPTEDLPRIFERFYRVDKSRSREMGGTGLGLAIVKHIIQTLNGEISVQSETNKGSAFTIKLPLAFSQRPLNNAG